MLQSVPDTAGSLNSYVLYYIQNPNLDQANVPVALQLVIEHGFTGLSEQNLQQLINMDLTEGINMLLTWASERPMDALEFHTATANMNFGLGNFTEAHFEQLMDTMDQHLAVDSSGSEMDQDSSDSEMDQDSSDSGPDQDLLNLGASLEQSKNKNI